MTTLVAGSKVLSYFADVRQSYGGLSSPPWSCKVFATDNGA